MQPNRIGLFTYHFSDNFGAVLQAYALRKWFIDRGLDAHFVNYHPRYVEEGGDFIQPFNPKYWRMNLKILYLKLSHTKSILLGNKEQAKRFQSFRTEMLGVEGKRLEHLHELNDLGDKYRLVVCGSDQIWNPSEQKGLDPAYFLNFPGKQVAHRISYAPSFGRDILPAAFHQQATTLFHGLSSISVREKSGIDIVKQLSNRSATLVPDPTFLHDSYQELLTISNEQREGHIFCYALRTGQGIREACEQTAQHYNINILSPYNVHRRWQEIGETVYPGPADWLKLIANAKCVMTNSFHGTVFAILFKRPFLVIGLPGAKKGLNERAKNLLAQLGLSDRFVEGDALDNIVARLEAPINWAYVDECRQKMKAAGDTFLAEELAKALAK
ncbi:polysaccharide pyruvyl transferase family protein [Agitococcus lubricus]|nr:polysaccharide pyruvyl transferase family protein [Agitococcus lubricus]